jgi:hypothetical protein
LVQASGLSVPAVGKVIEVDGRFGLEYERVEGVSMLQAILQRPWRFAAYARQLAGLQAEMHAIRLPEMPSQKDKLAWKIHGAAPLPENVRQAALQALDRLPEKDCLCHGDFHPSNILLNKRSQVIIDWLDASRGSPVMDIARSTLLFGGGPLPPGTPWAAPVLHRWFYCVYLQRYCQLNPIDPKELAASIPVAAAARLAENIHSDEARLLSIAEKLVDEHKPSAGTPGFPKQ